MFDKVLSMPPVLITSGFWIAQDSEYVFGSECARILDIPEFWICQDSEYAKVTQDSEYAWIILEFAWICQIMSGYDWIRRNMRECT